MQPEMAPPVTAVNPFRLLGLRERLASAGVISFDRPTANIEAGTSVSRRISDVALTGAELPTMARGRRSAAAWFTSAYRRITDLRGSMSVHRRIPDLAPKGAEGRSLTQLRHSGGYLLALDRL